MKKEKAASCNFCKGDHPPQASCPPRKGSRGEVLACRKCGKEISSKKPHTHGS